MLSLDALEVLLRFAALFADPGFRVVYNSLGAWASVNHLHFHPLYTEDVFAPGGGGGGGGATPVEDARRSRVAVLPPCAEDEDGGCARVDVYRLVDWEVDGFVLTTGGGGSGGAGGGAPPPHRVLAAPLWRLIEVLLRRDVPHNLLVADGGRTVVVLPRAPQAPHGGRVNIAVLEAVGLGVWFDEESYEAAGAEEYAAMLRAVSLDAALLDEISAEAFLGGSGSGGGCV